MYHTDQPLDKPTQRQLRVLIVDDDELFGRELVMTLECKAPDAFESTFVTSIQAAINQVTTAQSPFDIFLIDQHLSTSDDGITALPELLRLSPRSSAAVFTMEGDRESSRRAHLAGAYCCLHKPFSSEDLLLVLESLRDWLQTREHLGWLDVIVEIGRLVAADTTTQSEAVLLIPTIPRSPKNVGVTYS